MARRERQLRARLNLPQGLIERAAGKPRITGAPGPSQSGTWVTGNSRRRGRTP
jgi:hypothetical protein